MNSIPVNWSSYDAIILDLDGTIYDKRGLAFRMIRSELCHLRLLLAERTTRRKMRGIFHQTAEMFYTHFFQQIASRAGSTTSNAEQWYRTHYLPAMVKQIGLHHSARPEITELLCEAQKRHVKVIVFSDYEMAEDKLNALKVDRNLIAMVISAPEMGGLKPCQEGVMQLLHNQNINPTRCLVIGDRCETDGAIAQRMGCPFYLITD